MSRRLAWVLLLIALLNGINAAGSRADTLLRLNCGGPLVSYQITPGSYVSFLSDNYFTGSAGPLSTTHTITTTSANAPFAAIYQTCNTSTTTLTYTLPNFRPNRQYTARLHFAELSATHALFTKANFCPRQIHRPCS